MPLTLEQPVGLKPEWDEDILSAHAAPKPQSERIRQRAQRAYRSRNAYGEKTAAKVTGVLARAEKDVKAALLHYSTLGDLPEGKLANQRSLRRLQAEIRSIIAQVGEEHRLILKHASTDSFKRGLSHGIEEFVAAQLPFYKDLDAGGIDKGQLFKFLGEDKFSFDYHPNQAHGEKDPNGALYRADNGRDWQPVKKDFFPEGRGGNEADLAFDASGTAYCLLRGTFETPVTVGIGQGPDYEDWEWTVPEVDWYGDGKTMSADKAIRAPFGGPKFVRWQDGRLIAYGRVLGPEPGVELVPQHAEGGVIAGEDGTEPNRAAKVRAPLPESNRLRRPRDGKPPQLLYHASVTLFVFDPQRRRLTRLIDFPGYSHYSGVVEHDGSQIRRV